MSSLSKQAFALTKEKNYEKALNLYKKAIELDPNNDSLFFNQGLCLKNLGKYDDALLMYIKAIELNPQKANYYHAKGILLKTQGKLEESLKEYNNAILLDPNDSNYYYSKALCLSELEKYDDALLMYTKAIELNPQKANYYHAKGTLLKTQGKLEESLKEYNNAILQDPNDSLIYCNKAICLQDLQKYDDALLMFNKAIELNPQKADYYSGKAQVLLIQKKYEDSLKEYNKAIELDPKSEQYFNQSTILIIQGKYKQCIELLNKAIELNKNNGKAYTSKAHALRSLGQFSEAIQAYDNAIQYDPNYLLSYANKANLLMELGKNEDAVKCIKTCSKLFKEGNKNGLSQGNINFISKLINKFEKIEEDNIKIMEKVNQIVGNQKEKENLQVVAQKFTSLLNKISEQQLAKELKINDDESDNKKKLKQNESSDLDEIENQQKLIYQKLNDTNQTLLQQQQYFENLLKNMEDKLNQQQNLISDLNQKVNKINDNLENAGVLQKAELNQELLKLQKDENNSVFNYYKTFYWTSLNVLQTYRIISTNLVSGNYKSDATEFLENNNDKIQEGVKVCLETGKEIFKGAIQSIPIIGNIFNFIDKTTSLLLSAAQAYSDKKDQINFQNKVNAINQLISSQFQLDEDLSIKLALIGIKLAKLRKNSINIPEPKNNQKGQILSWLGDQISKVEDSHFDKTELHDLNDEGVKLALQDVILLISYISLYNDRIMLEKQDIVAILVDVVDKKIDDLQSIEFNDQQSDVIVDNNKDNIQNTKQNQDILEIENIVPTINENKKIRSSKKGTCCGCIIF